MIQPGTRVWRNTYPSRAGQRTPLKEVRQYGTVDSFHRTDPTSRWWLVAWDGSNTPPQISLERTLTPLSPLEHLAEVAK